MTTSLSYGRAGSFFRVCRLLTRYSPVHSFLMYWTYLCAMTQMPYIVKPDVVKSTFHVHTIKLLCPVSTPLWRLEHQPPIQQHRCGFYGDQL